MLFQNPALFTFVSAMRYRMTALALATLTENIKIRRFFSLYVSKVGFKTWFSIHDN